jgi:predicted metalloprotease with PDZ domain
MQMRSGLISVDEYFKKLSDKITISDGFRNDISLTELSESVYNEAITMEFINFYNKGAVTAALLDIRLLELSDGERGLREVFLELLERYGKYKSFSEDEFFEIFVESTYPEIEDFINNYIKGTKPLPYKEYVAMLGYNYIAERISEDKRPQLGLQIGMNDKQELVLAGVTDDMRKAGLQKGDAIYKVLGEEVTIQSANSILPKISSLSVGDSVEIIVKRDGVEIPAKLTMKQRMDRNIFEEMGNLTEDQKNLRDAWTKNL